MTTEAGVKILEALGFDTTDIVDASIRIRANEPVQVSLVREVVMMKVAGHKIKSAVENYTMVETVPLDPFKLGKED